MKKSNLIFAPEILGKVTVSLSDREIKTAIKKFRQNAPSAPIPRLYDAYRWLKEQVDTGDEESDNQFKYFIEHFLRILEERGASDSEIYTEVLRDSAEYKYLKGLFHNDEAGEAPLLIETFEIQQKSAPAVKIISLKDILPKKNFPLWSIDIGTWHKLVDEYLKDFKPEDLFVKSCSHVLKNISKRTEKESYHIEIIVVYAFDVLLGYKKISLKTKDFAMQLLNLMIDRGEIWAALHKEYIEIIKKPS